jgi:hypothetical protein
MFHTARGALRPFAGHSLSPVKRVAQGEFRTSSGQMAEGKVKTSKVVQHIGEAVQAQARVTTAGCVTDAGTKPSR